MMYLPPRTALPFCLATVLLASIQTAGAQSQDVLGLTARPPAAATGARLPPPVARPCVLLTNDNVLFGEAKQEGDFVVVAQGADNEIRLPRTRVSCWAGSLRALYRYRVDHRRPGDVQAFLRDAKWCIRYDLYEDARRDLDEVLRIDPNHSEAERVSRQLTRRLSPTPVTHGTVTMATHAEEDSPTVRQVGLDSTADDERLEGIGHAVIQSFAGDIQPMLMNRCARCHSHQSDRQWRLLKPATGTRASARMTRVNLSQAMSYLDFRQPEASPLWVKAVNPHGGDTAPLDPRHGKAIDALQAWIDAIITTANNRPEQNGVRNSRWRGQQQSGPRRDDQSAMEDHPESFDEAENAASAEKSWTSRRPNQTASHGPNRLPQVANPFDPDLFNRRYHGE